MKHLRQTLIALAALASAVASAQTETDGHGVPPTRNDIHPINFDQPLMADSLRIGKEISFPQQESPELPMPYNQSANFKMPAMTAPEPFRLWNGASIAVYGATDQMTGLMDAATGAVSLRQDFGRLHLAGSAIANKYWMPMQSQLYTQYGFGGTLGYDLTDAVSLHAFGYYYAQNPLVAPAFSPYISTTSFGGYANIRFSENFGTDVGVRRYVNPMSGRWTTEPIVNPYVRIGKDFKIELPLGGLLKAAIWGDRDNPMRFRPQPQPQPQKNKK